MASELWVVDQVHSREVVFPSEFPPLMSVEVWNSTMIDLPGGGKVSLTVDQTQLSTYLQHKLIPPFVKDGTTSWKYSFDRRPRPKYGNPDWDNLAGLTIYNEATVLINVANIWGSMLIKSEEGLLEEILKTVAHETNHVVQYSNPEMRAKAELDGLGRSWWKSLGGFLGWGFSTADGLIAGELVRRNTQPQQHSATTFTRRDFLKLTAGAGVGMVLGKGVAGLGQQGTAYVFDRVVDPSHAQCYKAESTWGELKNIIKIDSISL